MGSALSTISSELAISLLVAVGALGLGLGYCLRSIPAQPHTTAGSTEGQGSKKKKKKKAAGPAQSDAGEAAPLGRDASAAISAQVVAFPDVVPGQFDTTPEPTSELAESQLSTAGKSKKQKKKKAKGQETESPAPIPTTSVDQKVATTSTKPAKAKSQKVNTKGLAGPPVQETSASVDTDGSWTRVKPRRKGDPAQHPLEASTSDAGITTSATGNSSPVAERTEDETLSSNPRNSGDNRRTLAEKLLPKPRKTGVEDLLETPDVPTLSRVMRIKPGPDEKPASGYSWADYEDVRVTDGGENDADGEDDGWGVVKSRKPSRCFLFGIRSSLITGERQASSGNAQLSKSSTPEPMSKKQRQNAQKRDAQKAAKAASEEERLAAVAQHKRGLERVRMAEQAKKSGGKTVSGGMKASVDENGKLVWE
ncbi:hypothetical protein BKA70DRAFT_1100620 [Coprinopsis sp. MPI-PUGE-AT-0042]|nr:hypothetical protein BKA70DRAFT_1100620 [Coprinopsis sp. MPI-PUGE-AT-0042]